MKSEYKKAVSRVMFSLFDKVDEVSIDKLYTVIKGEKDKENKIYIVYHDNGKIEEVKEN